MVTDPRYIQYPRRITVKISWCLCDHVSKLIQETEGIQVLVVSTYGKKISKASLYAYKLVYNYIILCCYSEYKLKTKEEL